MPNELLVANKHGKAVGYAASPPAEKSFGGDGGFGLLYAMTGMAGRNSDLVQSKMGAASAYQLIPAVNRSINLRADAVQSLDWKLIAGSSKGKKKPVVLDDGDAAEAQTAFGQAMREAQKVSRIALIEQIVYAHDLYGEVYVEPLSNRYRTTGLKWLNPLGMYVIVEHGDLIGFRWTPQANDSQTYLFDADQIAYDKLFNPFDDFRGMGMVEVGIDTMNIARNLKRWLMAFFRNNARPGQVISPKPDSEFSPQNRNIIKTEVEMFAKGSDNAYSSLVLPIPMDIANFEQPDINNFYAINAPLQSEIYTIFGVPEALAGDQGKTRYKQGGDIMQAFYTNTIIPLSRWVEDYMNFQVLPFFNLGDATFEFDLSEFDTASADDKLRADIATEKFEATLITRDEARNYAGDTPVGGELGSAYYVPPAPVPPPGSAPITVSTPKPQAVPGGEAAKPQLPTGAKPPVPASAVPNPPSPTGQEKAITYLTPKQADADAELDAWYRKASKGNAQKAFVCEKTSKHVEAFIRAELEAIGSGAEKTLVRSVFEDARFASDLVSTKDYADTEDDFVQEVEQIISDGQDGTSSVQALGGQMRSAVRRYGLIAMRDGFNAAGKNPESFDADTLKAFRDWQANQSQYVSNFVQEVTKQGITPEEVSDRARMWRNRTLESARELGVTLGDDSTLMKWVEDGTKDKCPDCLRLDGQVHSMKAWNDSGFTPTSGQTECKSYNCLCSLEPTGDDENGDF